MNARLAATATAIMLVTVSAQASTLQFADAQRVQALRGKLLTASVDVTQAMEHALDMKNFADHSCLALLHDQAQEVGMVAAGVGDFMALSIMMKDSDDEIRTLSGLRTWLTALSNQLLHAREIINGTMSQCSNSATVNVKGQTLLNILSEWSDPVAVISKKVAQAVPPKR
jgi:hypothetical protein